MRVLIIDDASAVRRVLAQVLEEEPDITVAGTAGNGAEALEKLAKLDVDMLLLDMEMPGMGGLEFLRELRRRDRDMPVLLFSSLTERGAMITIEALLEGANDYVTKPTLMGSAAAARDYLRRNVVARLRALRGRDARAAPPAAATAQPAPAPAPRMPAAPPARAALAPPVDAVLIAASTGGPNALHELLSALPANLPVPVFVVQHMPAFFTQALARRLDLVSKLSVRECDTQSDVTPGSVWVAQGDRHLVIERLGDGVQVRPSELAPENFCRPSADVLFRSGVAVYGGRLLAVVLTGMGHDGLAGCREVHAAGGQIIVQDRESSVVWGMPSAVAEAGLAQRILPLPDIAAEILRRVQSSRPWFLPEPLLQPGVPT